MDIQPIQNINFGILKKVKQRSYGTYMEGEYKGLKYEVKWFTEYVMPIRFPLLYKGTLNKEFI